MSATQVSLEGLKQPPFNTTMMGVVAAALRYHGSELSDAMVYGLSGHAFLINVHEQICPSSPYCWKRERMHPLIANAGLAITDLGHFGPESTPEKRAAVERTLRDALDAGTPCSLMNMEHQLITGYDAEGFFTAQPWPGMDFPPGRLSFGTWKEFGKEIHVGFHVLNRTEPTDRRTAVLAGLDYAIDVHTNPKSHAWTGYHVGPEAYEAWLKALPQHGSGHGNWWTATVWGECRWRAAAYLHEIATLDESLAAPCQALSEQCDQVSRALNAAADKKLPLPEKVGQIEAARDGDAAIADGLKQLADLLRAAV